MISGVLSPLPKWEKLCVQEDLNFELVSFDSPQFAEILELRNASRARHEVSLTDELDSYSEHYIARQHGRMVAALRATRASEGTLDFQECYPEEFISRFRSKICSGSRFTSTRNFAQNLRLIKLLLEVGWTDQIRRGIRINIMLAHERAVPYWKRLGWLQVTGSHCQHPHWHIPCSVMLFPVTPYRETPMREVFGGITEPLEIEDIFDHLTLDTSTTRHLQQSKPR